MRAAASARLDGEPLGLSAAALEDHLQRCPQCSAWVSDAARLSRMVRVGSAQIPDLTESILASISVPVRRARRRITGLRAALALVGLAQLGLAVPDVFGDSMGMAMAIHAAHESAAWNVALGVAFLATAVRPRLAAGLLPMLSVFVVLLAGLSVYDLSTGTVDGSRLATHTACVIGLILVASVNRLAWSAPDPIVVADGSRQAEPSARSHLRGAA